MTEPGLPRRVGLLGGGVIGAGWAARFALHGVDVRVYDPDPRVAVTLATTITDARRALGRLLDSPLPPEGAVEVVDSVDAAVDGAELVQESAPERLELKRALLARADAVSEAEVVLASSTSGLRPSALREDLRHPGRLVVGHPFNPVYLLPLVEVCAGDGGDPAVGARVASWYRSVGMHPLVLRTETDGFVADRLLEALWREALWLVHDGVATTGEIDDAIRYGAGLRWSAMGTFLTYRLAGGEAGMGHFLEQFGPALQWPWTKLTDVPELSAELIARIVEQSDEQAGGLTIAELTARRDDCLVAVLQGLRSVGWGAGQVVADHDVALAARRARPPHLEVTFPDGHREPFHHLWLRDNCPCSECLHPVTRERVLDTQALALDVAPASVEVTADAVDIEWDDGHRSSYSKAWLRQHGAGWSRPASDVELWDASIADHLPERDHAQVVADDDGLAWLVDALAVHGLAFVRDVPAGALHDIARRVGPLRETNFGLDFQVVNRPDANNVAYTAVELGPHTDLTDVESPPGVQFLHCVAADAPGGDSTLVDGFAVAERLRVEDPEVFRLLCDVAIPYRFQDDEVDLVWSAPVITRDGDEYREVRFHNALRSPLDLPLERVRPVYAALARFHELATSAELRVRVRLRAGDLMVFRNRRVLHGRTAFDPAGGRRHLVGCYVDDDAWRSRRRMLTRR